MTKDISSHVAGVLAAFTPVIIASLYYALRRYINKSKSPEPPFNDTLSARSPTPTRQPFQSYLLSCHSLYHNLRLISDRDIESLTTNREIHFENDVSLPEYAEVEPGPPGYEMVFMPTSSLRERADMWPPGLDLPPNASSDNDNEGSTQATSDYETASTTPHEIMSEELQFPDNATVRSTESLHSEFQPGLIAENFRRYLQNLIKFP